MGIIRSKLFSKSKTLKNSSNITKEKKCSFKKSISADQERLIPERVLYNGYLMNNSISRELKCQFRVSHLDGHLKPIQKGYLGITTNELIFSHSVNISDAIFSWPLTTLRWYAYTHNMFIFQCGRKSPTGEGTFIFSCNEYQILKETFEILMNENQVSSTLGSGFRHFSKTGFYRQNSAVETRTEMINIVPSSLHPQFNRSQSMNAACHHSCVDRYSRLQDFSAIPQFRNCEDFSDLTSSESTVSSGTVNVSRLMSSNYLTEVTNLSSSLSGGIGGGGEYLVAANVPSAHNYVNQHDSPANFNSTNQSSSNYVNDSVNTTSNYLNFPNISNSHFLF